MNETKVTKNVGVWITDNLSAEKQLTKSQEINISCWEILEWHSNMWMKRWLRNW